MMLIMIFMILPRATVSAKRINEVLNTKVTIENGTVKESPAGLSGEIELST